jgi:phosphoribosylaminoimidazolecarboxamide formyltransferase/IMP cyclohydrolase
MTRAISQWFATADQGETFPETLAITASAPPSCAMARTRIRRPRSTAPWARRKGMANAVQVQGKELSYNNYNDADAALELVPNSAMPSRPS